jgi:hypothetical protein
MNTGNLFCSAPVRFAARRIAEVDADRMSPKVTEEVVAFTRRLVGWVKSRDIPIVERRLDDLILAMSTFPATFSLRVMAALNDRSQSLMQKAFQRDALLQRRIGHMNRLIFVDQAFSPARVARLSESSRRYIERFGVQGEE